MNLREFRNNKGLQRKFVSKKIGICGKHLNDIEIGKVNLTPKIAKKLSNVYDVRIKTIQCMYEEGKNETNRNLKSAKKTS